MILLLLFNVTSYSWASISTGYYADFNGGLVFLRLIQPPNSINSYLIAVLPNEKTGYKVEQINDIKAQITEHSISLNSAFLAINLSDGEIRGHTLVFKIPTSSGKVQNLTFSSISIDSWNQKLSKYKENREHSVKLQQWHNTIFTYLQSCYDTYSLDSSDVESAIKSSYVDSENFKSAYNNIQKAGVAITNAKKQLEQAQKKLLEKKELLKTKQKLADDAQAILDKKTEIANQTGNSTDTDAATEAENVYSNAYSVTLDVSKEISDAELDVQTAEDNVRQANDYLCDVNIDIRSAYLSQIDNNQKGVRAYAQGSRLHYLMQQLSPLANMPVLNLSIQKYIFQKKRVIFHAPSRYAIRYGILLPKEVVFGEMTKSGWIVTAIDNTLVWISPQADSDAVLHADEFGQNILSTAKHFPLPIENSNETSDQLTNKSALFVKAVFGKSGVLLPKGINDQVGIGVEIPRDTKGLWIVGDRLYISTLGATINTVGIYSGNGKFVYFTDKGISAEENIPDAGIIHVMRSKELLTDVTPPLLH
jgi:hypothetical protein